MFKNQKFFISLFCFLGLGIAQVAFAPDDPSAMYGSDDESGTDSMAVARNKARRDVENAKEELVFQAHRKSFFGKLKSVISGDVSLSEVLSGKADDQKVKLARRQAAVNLFDNQYPTRFARLKIDDYVADRRQRAVDVQKQMKNEKEVTEQEKQKEQAFFNSLPNDVRDLQVGMFDWHGIKRLSVVRKAAERYLPLKVIHDVYSHVYRDQASQAGLSDDAIKIGLEDFMNQELYSDYGYSISSMVAFEKLSKGEKEKIFTLRKSGSLEKAIRKSLISALITSNQA